MSTSTTKLGLTKPAAGEAYSRSVINNNSDIIDNYAINTVEKLAKGRNLKTLTTANSGAVGGTLTVINNVPSFTFKAGMEYTIIWDFQYYGSITNGYFEFTIATCSTADGAGVTTGLTVRNQRIRSVQEGGSSFTDSARVEAPVTFGSDTTLQLKFLAQLVANSGTVVVVADASAPALYIVDHLGDQI